MLWIPRSCKIKNLFNSLSVPRAQSLPENVFRKRSWGDYHQATTTWNSWKHVLGGGPQQCIKNILSRRHVFDRPRSSCIWPCMQVSVQLMTFCYYCPENKNQNLEGENKFFLSTYSQEYYAPFLMWWTWTSRNKQQLKLQLALGCKDLFCFLLARFYWLFFN